MVKRIKRTSGTPGPWSSGAIITGANLRRPSEKKWPPATPAKAAPEADPPEVADSPPKEEPKEGS